MVILDPSIGAGYRVVGVMPRGSSSRLTGCQWAIRRRTQAVPLGGLPTWSRRLPPDATAVQVQQRVLAAASARNGDRGAETGPATVPIDQVVVEPLGRALGATSRPLFAALLVAAAFLVAVAALNVSSLMAARAIDRGRELDVRRALGASALDIGRLLLLETALLVTAGTVGGSHDCRACAAVHGDTAADRPRALSSTGDRCACCRVRGHRRGRARDPCRSVAFATLANWQGVSRSDANRDGPDPAMGPAAGRGVQIALALVLTTGGALLVGSLLSVYAQTPPIATRNILTVSVQFLDWTLVADAWPRRG